MNFKSGSDKLGSADFRRALLISLALHAILLWQKWPAATGLLAQALPSRQAMFLNASLRNQVESPIVATTSSSDWAGKPQAAPHQKKPIPALRQPAPQRLPQTVLEVAAPAAEGPDANGLRQYRLSLAVAAKSFRLYPPQALENGWSGTVEVGLAIAANGVSQPVQLLRSSGYDVLDAAAMEMVGHAAQRTALPASLRGQSFSVPLPVVFDHDGR